MVALFKFIHIAAISIWVAGLIALPGLYVQRAHVKNEDELFSLQKIVRFSYVGILSPAAFIAIGTGTALIFLQETYQDWFSYKLVLIAILVSIHVATGLVIIRLFNEGEIYPVWRFIAVTVATALVGFGILYVVLAKPEFSINLPDRFYQPGGLKDIVREFSPWEIP
jgi:putative membrane protein